MKNEKKYLPPWYRALSYKVQSEILTCPKCNGKYIETKLSKDMCITCKNAIERDLIR